MSSTAGDEGQGGQFWAKEVRTHGLPFAAIFSSRIASLLSESVNSISAEAKKQSFTISESEKVFLAHAKMHAISKDASVKRSASEVVLLIRFCC